MKRQSNVMRTYIETKFEEHLLRELRVHLAQNQFYLQPLDQLFRL